MELQDDDYEIKSAFLIMSVRVLRGGRAIVLSGSDCYLWTSLCSNANMYNSLSI